VALSAARQVSEDRCQDSLRSRNLETGKAGLGPEWVRGVIRLLEVLLHTGNNLGGWSAKHIHQVILQSFQLSEKAYGLNQLRYDLRKLKGHGLIERDDSRYAYRLTSKGFQVALLFLFFHKRLSVHLRFHHQPDADHRPKSKLEAAYYKADRAIQDIVNLLDAA
jgi:hypothetical protein